MTVTVIIPTYKPDGKFRKLLKELKKNQTYPIAKNTDFEYRSLLLEGCLDRGNPAGRGSSYYEGRI